MAEEQLQGTTQNDILKEYLSRGTYAFPPGPSMRLIADTIAYTVQHVPKWNPINICSYHLQEAGATPVQEIAYAMSNAIAVLDAVRDARCPAGSDGQRVRTDLVLRQRGRPVRRGAREAARDGPAVGRARPRPLRRARREAPSLPLRRAGQLAGADRGAAREQRLPDRAGGAGGDARPGSTGPRDPAARLERGARPAAAVGSAVVPAPAADPRLRDRPARVPRHLRGLEGHGRARRGAASRARARRCATWPSSAAPSRRSTT